MVIKCENAKEKSEWIAYVSALIFNEWGKGNDALFIKKKNKMLEDTNIKPYIILDGNTSVGCFVITNNDIKGYPKYNPNLACVCVEDKYRGKGYSRYILKYSLEELRKNNIKEAYLKTDLINFYEKVGWIPLNEYCENEMIYKINL